ncbi:hypothetical protein E4U21_006046 [Claviceps maximensis]|nr:hypothetical protein E4U21_006046 [Claviceps maximensis]
MTIKTRVVIQEVSMVNGVSRLSDLAEVAQPPCTCIPAKLALRNSPYFNDWRKVRGRVEERLADEAAIKAQEAWQK